MSVTLEIAITNTRSLLDEPSTVYSEFWSDSELTTWLNEGCREVQRRAEWKSTESKITTIENTQRYNAPSDVLRIHRVTFTPTPYAENTYTVEFRGFMEMDQVWGINQQWPASYPLYYTLWGNPGTNSLKIVLYPVPNQTGDLHIYYFPTTTTAVDSNQLLDAPQGYEDIVYNYASYRAQLKDSNPSYKLFKSEYEEKLQGLIDMSRTYQDQANYFSTGQNALPGWLTSFDGAGY